MCPLNDVVRKLVYFEALSLRGTWGKRGSRGFTWFKSITLLTYTGI
jgi:hypothetical protein